MCSQAVWRSPEELVELGFARSPVVMMNEAHNGLLRSIRTREVGIRALPAAHEAGCRHFAMEAIRPDFADAANETRRVPAEELGYLSQPEMRTLIATALDLGWTLVAYEADFDLKPPEFESLSRAETNWREDEQARNLTATLAALPAGTSLLVWCGNSHLWKARVGPGKQWAPMGVRFWERSGVEPFAIDQVAGVLFDSDEEFRRGLGLRWTQAFDDRLEALGGTAGYLTAEAPAGAPRRQAVDAIVLSTENGLD